MLYMGQILKKKGGIVVVQFVIYLYTQESESVSRKIVCALFTLSVTLYPKTGSAD